jgi:signal transduction histidine kinase
MGAFVSRFGWLQDLSIRKKLSLLVGILVVNIATVVSMGIAGISLQSTVRAYVAGEGYWAKAQKNAIISLSRYAQTLRDEDFQDYLRFLQVPLGDRRARLELLKPHPDLRVSDAAFIDGGNHPDDVRGLALVFLYFHDLGPIRRAIGIWTEADGVLVELEDLGRLFRARVQRGRPGSRESAAFVADLQRINARLTDLENGFSAAMGETARLVRVLLMAVMIGVSLSLGLISIFFALLVSRGIALNIARISQAAMRAARGDLSVRVRVSSKDELGGLAEGFNAMAEGLARIDRLKGEFISNVSHELRTPLTLNLAPLEALLDGDYGALSESQREPLAVMRNNLLRLLQMVNEMLDFSKLEAGMMQVHREPTDVQALARSVLQDFRPSFDAKGLSLESQLDLSPKVLQLDRYLFERILFNLLANAVKFTPAGGQVSVRLEAREGQLLLSLSDTGIGISEEEAKDLFKKFSQAEGSATRRFEGTGLGLALVKECAQLLGGSVTLQSQPGKGSTFTVRVAAPASAAGAEPSRFMPTPWSAVPLPAPQASPGLALAEDEPSSRPKVLVAEDNPELASFMASLLEPNCEVRTCADGQEALQAVQAWRPDLLLSDVMMPGLDGISLCREIKRSPETGSIPVLLVTALTSREALVNGWEAGADDYLFKPFHPKELQARVRTLLTLVAWRRRSEEHRQRQEILSQFARIASHDLKAPLRTMASYAGLLLKDSSGRLDAESTRYLRVIVDSASRMHNMIEAMIRYAHLDPGSAGKGICDLNEVLRSVTAFLDASIKESQAQLDIGPMPVLQAVPEHVFALFQNLISNSLKYREPGRVPRITVTAMQEGADWHFSVADNGRGFDPSKAATVFTLFQRLHTSPEIPGDGMGLAIAKKIVESHGGHIWAEGRPGEGAVFHFTLPAERPHAALAA